MKPLFIVIEGLDGSGGTTQSRLLASWFKSLECYVVQPVRCFTYKSTPTIALPQPWHTCTWALLVRCLWYLQMTPARPMFESAKRQTCGLRTLTTQEVRAELARATHSSIYNRYNPCVMEKKKLLEILNDRF